MPQPIPPANAGLRILGADVAKGSIVFHDDQTGRSWSAANTTQSLGTALAPYADYDWLMCETTGGYERVLLATAAAVGLRAARVDAARAKAFIASHGGRAKTDRIDAAWLCRYGRERAVTLTPWQAPSPEREAFAGLLRHRQDLLTQRTQAKNRRGAPGAEPLHQLLDRQIDFLTSQIAEIDRLMAEQLEADLDLARREQILRAIPGIGPVAARTLIALMPNSAGSAQNRPPASPGSPPIPESPDPPENTEE